MIDEISSNISNYNYNGRAGYKNNKRSESSLKVYSDENDCLESTKPLFSENTLKNSYFIQSGNNSNPVKKLYEQYNSPSYKLIPDNESQKLTIIDKYGDNHGKFSYSDLIIRRDVSTGKEFIISEENETYYYSIFLDDDLKRAIQDVTKQPLDTTELFGYSIKTHASTGIQYILKDGEEGSGGQLFFQNNMDRATYKKLAETYKLKYPHIVDSLEDGYFWANLEIRGLAERNDTGIMSINKDGLSYSDDINPDKNWWISFSKNIFVRLRKWFDSYWNNGKKSNDYTEWLDIIKNIS